MPNERTVLLTDDQITAFITDGFVKVEGAFPAEVAADAREFLWRACGCDPEDPATWTRPVIRLPGFGNPPFKQAATAPALHEAFDQLVGRDRWVPRDGLGTFPIRFPSTAEPGDDGWHVDTSFPGDEPTDFMRWRFNVESKGRALLMLFLFSDIEIDDAPTRISVGSHLRMAKLLEPFGTAGATLFDFDFDAIAADLPKAYATGRAGDVYLCHPFLVHAAQPHHGRNPRFLAQPPLDLRQPCELDRADGDYSPLELAIRRGLAA
ncbi:phytanoyl-CoA dioxygenase family protein [Nocardia crassostreae]|uniref:phytanoyl-CoA dioxygenase family protein n=1 Tax=Nocardia crassostreae TaxID=53428 RepID=UPI0008310EA8|nr:phytanoyl-CoA dioxygenase family protein [Nocardia crassostreae]